jgi:hypothetical protein
MPYTSRFQKADIWPVGVNISSFFSRIPCDISEINGQINCPLEGRGALRRIPLEAVG